MQSVEQKKEELLKSIYKYAQTMYDCGYMKGAEGDARWVEHKKHEAHKELKEVLNKLLEARQ